jgi:hypothetical protein
MCTQFNNRRRSIGRLINYHRGNFNAFQCISIGFPRGFTRQLPNPATPVLAQPIHLINEFRHPMISMKVPAAVLTDDREIAYTRTAVY